MGNNFERRGRVRLALVGIFVSIVLVGQPCPAAQVWPPASMPAMRTAPSQGQTVQMPPREQPVLPKDTTPQRVQEPVEFTEPPGSQPSLESGPATRAAATTQAADTQAAATQPGGEVVAGDVRVRPTWGCLGINWQTREAATASVEFRRKGTDAWRPALPLFVHEFEGKRMLSGSLFRLCPGTEYEIRLRAGEAGGVERIVTARTLEYPRMPARGVMVNEGGLAKAQELAQPGQVMVLAKGTYPATALTKSGRPGAPIVYRAAKDGEVTIEGRIEIKASNVWLHGLVLRDKETAVEGSGRGVCVTGCRISAHYGIHTPEGAQGWFVADNTITGDAGGNFSFSGEGVDFGSDRGGGHAVCFNEITDTADGVSYGGGNIDVYGNYIHETVDDCVEPDYARENYRVFENRCYNSMCGFSFQPQKGGPWYFYNNVLAGNYLHALKVKRISGWTVLAGNTIVNRNPGLEGIRGFLRGWIVDNVWLRTTPGPLTGSGPFGEAAAGTRIDYNAYSDPELFAKIDYKDLAEKQGWDKHSVTVDWQEVFAEPVQAPASQPYYSEKLQGQPLPKDWRFPHSLFLPKEGSKLIDAGTALANLTGPHLGEAPDLGANELGLGSAWHGPRYWDLLGDVVYGIPQGWRSLTKDDPGKQPIIGLTGSQAILFNANKTITAMLSVEKATGEARWEKMRQIVADDTNAQTPVLEFQDGLVMRLYQRPKGLVLEVGRIEPDGVLHAVIQNREREARASRVEMFQFARSLYR